jgi:hypothetical protein
LPSEKVGKVLEEVLSDPESSFFDSDSDSSGIANLPVGEATAMERTEDEDSDSSQYAGAVQGVPSGYIYVGRHDKLYRVKRTICL